MKHLTKPMLGVQLDWSNPLNQGLAGFWLFNEGHGNRAYDLSMNGNHGILTGMAFPPTAASGWNPGRKGIGLNFDGVNDYVESTDIRPAKFTLSAWVYLKSISETYGVIFDKANTSHIDPYYDFHIRFSSLTNLYFAAVVGAFGAGDSIETTVPSMQNTWTFITATFDEDYMRLYINGIEKGNKQNAGSITYHATNLRIGSLRNLNTGNFNGSIDEVRIYNRALSASEIQLLYMNPYCMFMNAGRES